LDAGRRGDAQGVKLHDLYVRTEAGGNLDDLFDQEDAAAPHRGGEAVEGGLVHADQDVRLVHHGAPDFLAGEDDGAGGGASALLGAVGGEPGGVAPA
jgi:hypothetical protein